MASEDYFQLFGLPAKFAIDVDTLDATWRRLAARVHPDRYATAGAAERRVAMQWASTINDAHRTLKSPIARARYLCERAGCDLQTESNTRMDGGFLLRQMEWREQLDEVRSGGNIAQAETLQGDIETARDELQGQVERLIDSQQDFQQASGKVREWMFLDKLLEQAKSLRNELRDRPN
ncbi:MAG TPA: Fe-S protein assembly co-chaperone HscB [Pusillimonas sp.]|uniref:Fe-S protein assembly co-chaperone HscB n=1 Tax=Pusillimonas sp. TaxID=3040095 RepID=UPI002C689909|nr:Fe-S protein assembly co-chaperone HscB [Pusillimonas sp.]HUH86973.1 Fe-S protein assembly co-chaperone HscB [Pusillimonas sp.]